MNTIESVCLTGTPIVTSRLGFGCASLMRLPTRKERQDLLSAALDVGIRHFDVARMYGFGQVEEELGIFASTRRESVSIATKFGIAPRVALVRGRRFQSILRAIAGKFPTIKRIISPHTSQLYVPKRFDVGSAALSLSQSLAQLRTDYVDILFMHDPEISLLARDQLLEWFSTIKRSGQIRAFGAAGYVENAVSVAKEAPELVEVLQIDNDALRRQIEKVDLSSKRALITFSPVSAPHDQLVRFFAAQPDIAKKIRRETGLDLANDSSLARVLLSYALRSNRDGIVLFFTSKIARVHDIANSMNDGGISDEVLNYVLASFPKSSPTIWTG